MRGDGGEHERLGGIGTRALDVTELTVGWDDLVLLRGLTFHVNNGEIFSILGGTGSGKSTLMRFLVGLEKPLAGKIDIAGRGPPNLDEGLPPFGVMFQEGALFSGLTLGDNIALALEEWTSLPPDVIHTLVVAKLRLVGLEDAIDKHPSELSGGMRKRGAVARALALDPTILFLDEPTAGLDPVSAAAFDELVVALNRALKLTVVMVTHELPSLFHTTSRCILLDKEEQGIIAEGEPHALRQHADPRVHAFFNRESRSQKGPVM